MREIFFYFLRLGCVGFGGPLSLVAQMQRELVDERRWISQEEFIQSLALIKSMPGALAFSTATYMGYRRGGFWGGTIAGWSLVLPAFCLILVLAQMYDQVALLPGVSVALAGMQAAALALIVLSIRSLVKGYEKRGLFWVFVVAGIGLVYFKLPEPVAILSFGLFSVFVLNSHKKIGKASLFSVGPLTFLAPQALDLFLICFKSGALVFGTGLAMVPILEGDFVDKMQWISHTQFMDALAFGQMTPGPVLITVTFVGYKVTGLLGAVAATVGVFLPSHFHMTTWFPRVTDWLSKQKWISSFILGALAAVVATLVMTTYKLCGYSSWRQNALVLAFILLSLKWKVPSWALILAGAGAGLIFLA